MQLEKLSERADANWYLTHLGMFMFDLNSDTSNPDSNHTLPLSD